MAQDVIPASETLHIRFSSELLAEIDRYAADLSARARIPVSRTAALRSLVQDALDAHRKKGRSR